MIVIYFPLKHYGLQKCKFGTFKVSYSALLKFYFASVKGRGNPCLLNNVVVCMHRKWGRQEISFVMFWEHVNLLLPSL